MADTDDFVRSATQVTRFPFVPELRVRVATELMPLWEATQTQAGGRPTPPPFWAFAWPGGLAFARYLLDEPGVVLGRRVLDFGSGCGIAAVAAARAGAARVRACDVDPMAAVIQRQNAALNDVEIEVETRNLIGRNVVGDVDVVLAGDVCYERDFASRSTYWLEDLAGCGVLVLLADPGRAYLPLNGLVKVVQYDVPTTLELERDDHMQTTIWRFQPD